MQHRKRRGARALPTVKTLIELGADTAARAVHGLVPRDIAAEYGLSGYMIQ